MSLSNPKLRIFTAIFLLTVCFLNAADNYPSSDDLDSFQKDLERTALVGNLPNAQGTDHFIGLSSSASGVSSMSEGFVMLPSVRLNIYPNPGYNIWAQFGTLPVSKPSFSVGTGIQVSFQGENLRNGQALGVSWNKIHGDGYSQRDISVHGMLSRYSGVLSYGLMAIYDMHHVLVWSVSNFESYDKNIIVLTPYIKWAAAEPLRLAMKLPMSGNGTMLQVDIEYLLGKRK